MNETLAVSSRADLLYVVGAALVLAALLLRFMPGGRHTAGHSALFLVLCLLLEGLAAALAAGGHTGLAGGAHQLAMVGLGLLLIRLCALVLFRVLLPALRLPTPRIVEDIVVIGGYLLWVMLRLNQAGVELSSLVATSAVITAVAAFAMQDTLGNILGGLALQLDNSLEIGDWVKLDDLSGRVVEIQWRYTALLTRNGERVVVPNAQLMRSKFMVLAHAGPGAAGWRRRVDFHVDYSASPSQVIAAAQRAVADAEIAHVAATPGPSCVAMDFTPGAMRYALRYWLTDPAEDDTTDSAVRTHLLATLQRQGWRVALPDQKLHLVRDDGAHRAAAWQRELARRLQALAGTELFSSLDEQERRQLAERLVNAPFAAGDLMTRQGATAHWLYIIVRGEADVLWQDAAGERHALAHLSQGHFFGEMGLMTGAPRGATVVAATDVDCYRLDKAGFEDVLRRRPAMAESICGVLAERARHNSALQHEITQANAALPQRHADILERMRAFFGLD